MNKSILTLVLIFSLLPSNVYAARLWTGGAELLTVTDLVETDTNGAISGISTATKRSGAASWSFTTSGSDGAGFSSMRYLLTADSNTAYWRGYINIASAPSVSNAILSAVAVGSDAEGSIMLNTDRTLSLVADDGTTVVGSDSTVLSLNTWYRLEYSYNGLESMELKLDGTTIISVGVHDGDNINGFRWGMCTHGGANCSQGSWFFDDVAINNTSGAAQTAYPGEGSVVAIQPNSAGDTNGCSAGDFASVDEITPDDATTICVMDANSDTLDVNVNSSSSAGINPYDTITLVQVGVREAAVSAASETWNPRLKSASGGTTSAGSATAHDDVTYRTNGDAEPQMTYKLTSYTDPTTGIAWTPTGTNSIDNMQIGIASTDANPDINVSTLWAIVEYIDGQLNSNPNTGTHGVPNEKARGGVKIRGGVKFR